MINILNQIHLFYDENLRKKVRTCVMVNADDEDPKSFQLSLRIVKNILFIVGTGSRFSVQGASTLHQCMDFYLYQCLFPVHVVHELFLSHAVVIFSVVCFVIIKHEACIRTYRHAHTTHMYKCLSKILYCDPLYVLIKQKK